VGDYIIPPPANPGPAADVTWFDTGDGGMPNVAGVIGELKFDQPVTLFIESAVLGSGTLIVTNGSGSGQVIAAGALEVVAVRFRGARTRLRLRTGHPAPSANSWHVNGRAIWPWLP
jgi:hypothetical protein